MNKKKSTGLLLSILGVLSLVLITAGVTYAFFSYAKEGLTENSITTGTITFIYDELAGQAGNQIRIENALPMTDDEGKALQDEYNVFNFTVTSTVSGDASIPYEVTARKKAGSTLSDDQIKLYLTSTGSETNGENFTLDGTNVKTYADLTQTSTDVPTGTVEKTIYKGTVPAKSNYTQNFELRMWIAGGEDGNGAYTGTDYSAYEFVKKSAFITNTDGTDVVSAEALSFDTLLTNNNIITSTAYYALDDAARSEYERIAYVNTTSKTLYTVTQAAQTGFSADGYTASEQYYPLNGQSFTVTVNVYANATVVNGASN